MLLPHLCNSGKPFMPLSLRTQGLVQKIMKEMWWNCIIIAFFKLHHSSVVWKTLMVGSQDSFLLETHCSRIIIMKGQIRKIVFSCMQHLIEPAFDRATVFAWKHAVNKLLQDYIMVKYFAKMWITLNVQNRTHSNMDERAVVFFTQKKFFLPPSVFYYNFYLERDSYKISMWQYTLTWRLPKRSI